MLTFLVALMVVFFDGTNSATRISVSLVLLILVMMIALLLYLERDNTVSGETSPYMGIYRLIEDRIFSWWKFIKPRITGQKGGSDSSETETEVASEISLSKWASSRPISTPSP